MYTTQKDAQAPGNGTPANQIPNGYDFSDVEAQRDPATIISEARVDLTQETPKPPTALRIGSEIYGTLGNFSMQIGKAKSRKTFASVMAMAGALGYKGPITGCLPINKNRVVLCDTEQGRYHVEQTGKRVLRLLETDFVPPNFDVFSLRSYDTEQRLAMIEHVIENTPDLGLLVIDGIRDVVTGINDEEQATIIAGKLLKWTEQHQIHIIVILHQNKKVGDRNARGHLGSELVNKAETTVSIEKEKDNAEVSKFEAEYTRNKEFEPFGFMINDQGLPEVVQGWTAKKEKEKKRGLDPLEIDPYKHHRILQRISKNVEEPRHAELIDQIILAVSSEVGETIGTSKAKIFASHYKNEGWIEREGKERSPKATYKIHPNRCQ